MAKGDRKPKRTDPLGDARRHIKSDNYLHTSHVEDKKAARSITLPEILMVFESGSRETNRDRFDARYDEWSYSIVGRTIDGRRLRVIFSFEEDTLLLVTTYELKK